MVLLLICVWKATDQEDAKVYWLPKSVAEWLEWPRFGRGKEGKKTVLAGGGVVRILGQYWGGGGKEADKTTASWYCIWRQLAAHLQKIDCRGG
jgi:hypothetical protein